MILSHFDDLSLGVSFILPTLEIAKLEAKSPKALYPLLICTDLLQLIA